MAILQANAVVDPDHLTTIINAFKNSNIHKDFRLYTKFYENNSDKGINIDIQDILMDIEKKHENLMKHKE